MNRKAPMLLGLLTAAGVVGLLFLFLDAPTAGFFAFAIAIVTALGAAPVVFSVHTRRQAREHNERIDREETIRRPPDHESPPH